MIGLIGLLILAGIGFVSGDPTAMPILTLIGGIGAVFFAALAIPGLNYWLDFFDCWREQAG